MITTTLEIRLAVTVIVTDTAQASYSAVWGRRSGTPLLDVVRDVISARVAAGQSLRRDPHAPHAPHGTWQDKWRAPARHGRLVIVVEYVEDHHGITLRILEILPSTGARPKG